MSKPFKLSAALYGHSLDVRALVVGSDNTMVSGSRDKTAKLWTPNGFNTGYNETMTYKEQKNFVASVLYLEPTKEFPNGVVITGGNDNVILVYRPHEPFATLTLKGHSNVVCNLHKGVEKNTLLSASWDMTAKLWSLETPSTALVTFSGHSAAVWVVLQLKNTNVVTGSADKTICIWSKDGHKLKVVEGHTDCVRAIADFPDLSIFLSVSNDATVKAWTCNGENIETYYGHTNYIYSIARNKAGGDNCFVTSDEDRTVRYWKNGVNTESFQLPAQSVWTVACLNNGDIVTGSSDGVVRIFTQNDSRVASKETLKKYEEEVEALSKQSVQEIGGYKVSDLPGREALYEPGKRAGQMKMIREATGVVAYTWVEDGDNSHWDKIGDVLGGNDKANEGKTMFEGQPYDYVFSVDVEDGKPAIKLPFNKGDDPYVAANKFLERNMLPPIYLDQVVEFILKNSREAAAPNNDYIDPFTGGSRYTPGSGSAAGPSDVGSNLDPFTGGMSYTTQTQIDTKFFPQTTYRLFEAGDPNVILGKLKEFNKKSGDGNSPVNESILEGIVKLCTEPASDPRYLDVLFQLLNWNDEIAFPVIDVIRLAVRIEQNNKLISTKGDGCIMEKLKYYVSRECKVSNNTLVAFRVLCNFCCHQWGQDLLFENRIEILEDITGLSMGNKNVQIGLATFLLNITILCMKRNDEIGSLILASVLPDIAANIEDPEGQFRVFVAIGTLTSCPSIEKRMIIKDKIKENPAFLQKLQLATNQYANDVELKRKRCAIQIQTELANF